MSKTSMLQAKCRLYGLPEAYAELMDGVQGHDDALDRIKRYKDGLQPSGYSTMVNTDHAGQSVSNVAMMYDRIGRCLKCGKLTYKYWAICDECADYPMNEDGS